MKTPFGTKELGMVNPAYQYPIFGPEIQCPHCRQTILALTLTDTYLCQRHGAFEADSTTGELIHLQSGRHWRQWDQQWYRQHTHPDGLRFEIHEALDRLYTQGLRATEITIAERYRGLLQSYWQRSGNWSGDNREFRIYGLPVRFSPSAEEDLRWSVINFTLEEELGIPQRYPHFRLFE
jgi:uncharacterized protein (TIGR02652 family)